MTDNQGPEPTLADLLDELIDAAQESVRTGGVKWTSAVAELRAAILARFGGTSDYVLHLTYDEAIALRAMTSQFAMVLNRVKEEPTKAVYSATEKVIRITVPLAQTETEAAAKEEVSGGPG